MRAAIPARFVSLFASLRSHPASRPAVTDLHGTHTYGALLRRAAALRPLLPPAPSPTDDPTRIAILTHPSSVFVSALLASWSAPAAAVPLSPLYPPPALAALLLHADPALILADRATYPALPPSFSARAVCADAVPVPRAPLAGAAYALQCDALSASAALSARPPALLLFTSGTTARPKPVVWTHRMVLHHVRTLSAVWRVTPADRVLAVLPLHHVHGLVNVLLTALHAGAHVEMHPAFDPARVWHAFTRPPHASPPPPSVFMAVPAVYAKLIAAYDNAAAARQAAMRHAARSLRLFVCGSASLSRALFDKWRDISGQRILERYGMTETGMTLSNLYERREQGALGWPLPGVEARVRAEGADGAQGELLVRGPGVFAEYWRDPKATREAFTEDGWFKTGDVVSWDRESGLFRMIGRASSDIIKTGGFKVSAIEIEEVLRECPAVTDCCVVGVDDNVLGQCIVAALITPEGEGVVEAAREWAAQNLPRYKVPRRFVVVEDFPRNMLGKVQRQVLKASIK